MYMTKLNLLVFKFKAFVCLTILSLLMLVQANAQTPIVMSGYTSTPYVEDFSAISTWSLAAGTFTGTTGAAAWKGYAASTASVSALPRIVPNPNTFTIASLVFASGTGGGLQKGSGQVVPVSGLTFLATGGTDSTQAVVADFFMDFTGVNAGTFTYDALAHSNPSGTTPPAVPKQAKLAVYWSVNGTTWTELPVLYSCINTYVQTAINILRDSASFSIALPAAFNNNANARLRFYNFNATSATGSAGNRPRIILDKITVSALSSCTTPLSINTFSPTTPSIICAGSSIALSATATGTSNPITYAWTSSTSAAVAGLSATTGSSVSALPTASTVYTVTATSGQCSATQTFSVTVLALPAVSITPSSSTVCAGGTQTLVGANAATYSWAPAASLNSASGSTVISTPTATTTYTLTGTDANGCVNTATALVTYISSVNVSVSPSSPAINCIGDVANLSASGANSYVWSNASGLNDPLLANVIATPSTTTTYTVTGTAGACTGTTVVTVTVNNNPIPMVSIAAPTTGACVGGSTTLTASGANTYAWANPATLSASTGAIVTATPTAATTYTVVGTSAAGCSASASLLQVILPLPNVTASSSPATICAGSTSTLTAIGADTYSWSNSGAMASTSVSPMATTNYTVVGTDVNGCSKSASVTVFTASNGAIVNYTFQTSIPYQGIYNDILSCNANLYSASGISFGNQNGSPSNQFPNGTGSSTYSGQTSTGAGSINAGAACKSIPYSAAASTYVEFYFVPECGYTLQFKGISFGSRSTNTGPQAAAIYTSADNFSAILDSNATLPATSAWVYVNRTFATPVSNGTGDTLKIRIYGFNGTGNGGTNTVNWRLDDLKFMLSTSAITPVYPALTVSPSVITCPTVPVSLSASGAGKYMWANHATLSDSVTSSVTANPTTTTTYTVTGTQIACSTTATVTVTIVAPASTFSATTIVSALPYVWNGNNYNATGVYSNTYTLTSGCDSVATLVLTVNANPSLLLAPKVFLSGAYKTSTGLMSDSLRILNLIPTAQPYGAAPYTQFTHVGGGSEILGSGALTATGNNAIVDWVFVELRSGLNSATVVATQSALVQADGDVVSATDGTSALSFAGLTPDNYFVSIKHRNHNGVMTATAVALSASATTVDFTSTSTALYLNAAPNNNPSPLTGAARLQGSVRTLYAGNCLINSALSKRTINYGTLTGVSDRLALFNAVGFTGSISGYSIFDLDLNGKATYNGINADRFVLLTNTTSNGAIFVFEQTPN
jgi:hypothetical protein